MKSIRSILGMFCALLIANSSVASSSSAGSVYNNTNGFNTFNQKYYQNNELLPKFLGDLVAVAGVVTRRQEGPQGKSIVQIKLDGVDKHLWIGTTMKLFDEQLQIGTHVDALGFFDETKNEPDYIGKVSDDVEYLIGFCFNERNSGMPIYFTQLMNRCMDWEAGKSFEEETKTEDKKE